MKVLQVLHVFLPRHSAGTEVYTDGLSRALQSRGHSVELFFTEKLHARPNYSLVEREHDGLPCHVLVNNLLYRDYRETFRQPEIERRFAELLARVRPDVVHFQHLWMLSLQLPAVAREAGIPSLMTLHDFWLYCPRHGQLLERGEDLCPGPLVSRCARCVSTLPYRQRRWQAALLGAFSGLRRATGVDLSGTVDRLRHLLPSASRQTTPPEPAGAALEPALDEREQAVRALVQVVPRFLSPSHTVRDFMVAHGLPEERVVFCPNGLPWPASVPPRGPRDGPLTVAFLGTIAPHKGLHVLLDAWEQLGPRRGRLRVVGSGRHAPAYHAAMKRRCEQVGGAFEGPLERARVGEFLRTVDVLVVPSLWMENAPVVIQEARLHGAVVVASRLGGMAEAVADGRDGLLFEMGNARNLARCLDELLEDPQRLDRLVIEAPPPRRMEDHVMEIEQHYRDIAEEAVT